MSRTIQSLMVDAQEALNNAGLTRPEWTQADVISAKLVGNTRTRLVGELGWRSARVRFVVVDRSLLWKLPQQGQPWRAGISGWFLLRVALHRRYGFQVEIFDVLVESLTDSSSHEIVADLWRRVKTEPWATGQRALPDPDVPSSVAVVSSSATDGYTDFTTTLPPGVFVRLVETPMAGPAAPGRVVESLRQASVGADLIVIARGGGSRSGMEWANDERVVRAVAGSPIPVWTAIGHANDSHLIDDVAHRSFATPTQAASELSRRVDIRASIQRHRELEALSTAAERRALDAERTARRQRLATILTIAVVIVAVATLGVWWKLS